MGQQFCSPGVSVERLEELLSRGGDAAHRSGVATAASPEHSKRRTCSAVPGAPGGCPSSPNTAEQGQDRHPPTLC